MKTATSVTILTAAAVVSRALRSRHWPAMKGYHNFRGGVQEQMTATEAEMYRRLLIARTTYAAQKNPFRTPRGTKMRVHSNRMAAFANPMDTV